MLGQFATDQFTDEVFLVDDWLVLVHADKEELLSLTRIDSVEVADNDSVRVVTTRSSCRCN